MSSHRKEATFSTPIKREVPPFLEKYPVDSCLARKTTPTRGRKLQKFHYGEAQSWDVRNRSAPGAGPFCATSSTVQHFCGLGPLGELGVR